MTTSIIVYRNPLEQQLWEGASGGQMFPIMCGMFVMLISFLIIIPILAKLKVKTKNVSTIALGLSFVAFIATVYTMWI